jgi:hypothetical protein
VAVLVAVAVAVAVVTLLTLYLQMLTKQIVQLLSLATKN